MKYKLYLTQGMLGEEREYLGGSDTIEDIWGLIAKFVKTNAKVKCYYYRQLFFEEKNTVVVDYGSHSEFLSIEARDKDAMKEAMGKN